jgi:hypothetical protein
MNSQKLGGEVYQLEENMKGSQIHEFCPWTQHVAK